MKRFVLFGLLAAALAVLAAPRDASAGRRRSCGVVYTTTYYCPPYYHTPSSHAPTYPVVEVGAHDGRGFDPKTLPVAPGTVVRWVNRGQQVHTVTSRDGKFDSGDLRPGASYSVRFVTPGTYHYFCRPHEKMGMVGTVIVGASGGSGQAEQETHDGTFVSARSPKEFVMEDKGKEHSHTLSADAKVIGPDGKEVKLTDLKKGQKIRVTTRKGDMKTATRVEALKDK